MKLISLFWLAALLASIVSCAEVEPMPGPTIYLKQTEFEINIDSTLVVNPKITYDYGTSYQWWLNGSLVSTTKKMTHISNGPAENRYTFIASTANGADTAFVTIHSLYILDFEDFKLKKDTAMYGQDGTTQFSRYGITFPVLYGGGASQWEGYAVSTGTIKTESSLKNRYSAYFGSGSAKSRHYAVFHQDNDGPAYEISFEAGTNRRYKSIEVTNTSYLYYVIKSGKDVPQKFGEGQKDWFVLTIDGFDDKGAKTGSIPYYLADYTNDVKTKRYMVESWSKIDLTPLGPVNKLRFTLTSSQTDANGMITPGYFCFDNLKIID
jgi:hypothetical protein